MAVCVVYLFQAVHVAENDDATSVRAYGDINRFFSNRKEATSVQNTGKIVCLRYVVELLLRFLFLRYKIGAVYFREQNHGEQIVDDKIVIARLKKEVAKLTVAVVRGKNKNH